MCVYVYVHRVFLYTLAYTCWSCDFCTITPVTLTNAGSQKHSGRRGPAHNMKDADGSSPITDGKPLRRGGSSGYGSHEVWFEFVLGGDSAILLVQLLITLCQLCCKCRNRCGFKSQVLVLSVVINGMLPFPSSISCLGFGT